MNADTKRKDVHPPSANRTSSFRQNVKVIVQNFPKKGDVKTTTKKSIYSLKASNIAFKTNAVVDPGFPRGGGTNPKGGGGGSGHII